VNHTLVFATIDNRVRRFWSRPGRSRCAFSCA